MEGVESVTQLSDTRTHWLTEIAVVRRQFEADIIEQTPDQRIAWSSTEQAKQAGVVTFHRIDDNITRVVLQLDFEPEGAAEKTGDWLGIVRARTKGDLERFKAFIESRGTEPGGWRGEVEPDATT